MIFNSSRCSDYKIRYGNIFITQCQECNYLSITFTPSGSFKKAKKMLTINKSRKDTFFILRQAINGNRPLLYCKSRAHAPIIRHHNHTNPAIYGSEVWGLSDIKNMLTKYVP